MTWTSVVLGEGINYPAKVIRIIFNGQVYRRDRFLGLVIDEYCKSDAAHRAG